MSYIGNTAQTQGFTPAIDYFSGNASTTAFTLSRPVASVAQVQAVIENVPQNPGDAFTVSGNTITFTSAPPSGTNNIYVYYTSPITTVVQPGQGTVYPTSLSTGGPYWSTSGYVGVGTTSPARDLTLTSSGNTTLQVTNSTSGTGASDGFIVQQNGLNSFVLNQEAGALYLGTSNTERMTVDSSGNVGIGTTSPQAKLDISNTGTSTSVSTRLASSDSGGNSVRLITTQNANGSVTFNANAGGNGSAKDIIFQQTGSEKMRINTVGSREFGTYNTNDINTGEATIAWGNVSSTTFDITTLFPNVLGLGSGVGIIIQLQTWTGGFNSGTSVIGSGARASSSWAWATVNNTNTGGGPTVTFSGSGNVVTISFSFGAQYGKARIMLLGTA